MTTISAREFNQDVSGAKRAASTAPVVITDRGTPSHVLLSIEEYRRLSGETADDIAEFLASLSMTDDLEFEPGRFALGAQIPDL